MGSLGQSIVTNQGSGRRFFKRACTRLVLDGAMPPDPYDGVSVLRKDLGEEFVWNATLGIWIGATRWTWGGFSNVALTNAYLYFDDLSLPGSAALGFTAPFDCRVIGLSGLIPVASTCTLECRDDGVAAGSLAFVAETRKWAWLDAANPLIAAGSNISFYCNGTSGSAHRVDAWFARSVS